MVSLLKVNHLHQNQMFLAVKKPKAPCRHRILQAFDPASAEGAKS